MKPGFLFAVLCICPLLAHAEIYKSVDENGHVTYSSKPLKGGKKLNLEPLPTMMPPAKVPASSGFPKVDNETQKNRDEARRKILKDELDAEEKQLAEANQNLKEGESNPEVYTGADGKTFRNVAKYEEKIKALQEQVDLHQNNIEALKTELSKLKGVPVNPTIPRKSDSGMN
ncbi:MAG: DUF4124 domain-containing protein [Nitrosomonadales bacterium]|nr:DUF4124 domain-containing protein [Nitrosomonadales bacterium]